MTINANLDNLSEQELEDMIQNDKQPEGDEENGTSPNDGDDKEKDDAPDADDKVDDDGSDDGESSNDDGDDGKKQPPKSIQKLLKQRNEAREKADAFETKLAEQDNLINELKSNKDETLSDTERSDKLLDAKLDKKMLEQDGRFEQKRQEDLRNSEINTFVDANPDIGKYKKDFIDACNNYKDLSPRQVYAVLADEMGIGTASKGPGYGIAGGSKTKSGTPLDVSKMSESQLETEISNFSSNGSLL